MTSFAGLFVHVQKNRRRVLWILFAAVLILSMIGTRGMSLEDALRNFLK